MIRAGQAALDTMAKRIRASGIPTHFDPERSRLLIEIWRLVSEGKPVTSREVEAVAQQLKIPVASALSFIYQLAETDAAGNVVGLFGLSQRDHAHKFTFAGKTFSTWCAWDALFLPPMLQQPARIDAICPQTQESITIEIDPAGIKVCLPRDTVLSIVMPPAGDQRYDNVQQVWDAFCCEVHFFASETAASQWFAAKEVEVQFLSVAAGFELGSKTFEEMLEYV